MKARSCSTALVDVVDDLRLKLDENYMAFLILLDHTNGVFFSVKKMTPSYKVH